MKGLAVAVSVLAGMGLLLALGFICGADIYFRVADYRERRQAAREGIN